VHVVETSEAMLKASLAEGASSIGVPEASECEGSFDRVFDLVGTGATTELAGRLVKRQGRIVVMARKRNVRGSTLSPSPSARSKSWVSKR
jgi:D-arabinose 1-dehydrogenase-like Zn-dependent alcohol dehydrogenase